MRRLYYIHPRIQFTFMRYVTVLVSVELICFAAVLLAAEKYAREFPEDYAVYIYYGAILLMVLLFSAMNMYFGARFSHRIAGPLVQLERVLSKAIRGDYSVRVRLRANDYLQEVSENLNELLQHLEESSAAKTPLANPHPKTPRALDETMPA